MLVRSVLLACALAVSICALAAPSAPAAPVRVAGTRVSLDPPRGFVKAQRYPGFERADKKASIMVTELPGPAKDMQKGMTKEMLAGRGVTLIRSQTVRIENVESFAKDRASKTSQVGPLRNAVGREVTVDGLRGYELIAEGDEVKSGRAVRMYQLILADGLTYYIAQGFVAADRPADVMDLFRKVTGSFRKVQTGR